MDWNNKNNSKYVRAVRSGKCSLLSFDSVYRAYLDCRKRKRGTLNALRFEFDAVENLIRLASELQKRTYRPSRSVCFVTRHPKLREVFAADFQDRIVHHLAVRELEKYWEPRFIHDSYAGRKGKGTHGAVKRLQQFMGRVTKSRKQPGYFLQLDIRSFFMSIDKQILYAILKRHTESEALRSLLSVIIFHDCTQDYQFRGNRQYLEMIPPHKSLFKVGQDKGLPIGNLSSQFFANVYLNELDQYVKHVLRCRFYIRYVDDFILLSANPDELLRWQYQISCFLDEYLALEIKPGSTVKRVSDGADFLGYIVRPDYILARRRVVNNLKYRLENFRPDFVKDFIVKGKNVRQIVTDPEKTAKLRQVLASYMGHFRHADTFRLLNSLFDSNPWLKEIFIFDNGKLKEKYPIRGYRFFKTQVCFFRQKLKGHVVFFRVGRYIELYEEDAFLIHTLCPLRLNPDARGMKQKAGFRKHRFPLYLRKILGAGHSAALVEESGIQGSICERYVQSVYLFAV